MPRVDTLQAGDPFIYCQQGTATGTPGMRELQMAGCEYGVEETFTDIVELSTQCKFTDCQHVNEAGCSVQAQICADRLEKRRLSNYLKLMREQAFNKATLTEKRARDRELGRFYRSVQAGKRQLYKK